MPDVSGGSGRRVRFARTQSARLGGRKTTVQSVRTQRAVPKADPNIAAGGAALAGALGSFFPGLGQLVQTQQAVDIDKIEKENEQFALDAFNAVHKAPQAAREAIRNGDLTQFAPSDEARSRRAFVDTFKITAAQLGAHEDFEEGFKPALAGVSLDGDPEALREDFLKSKLEGADPVFEAAYNKTFEALARPELDAWRQGRADFNAAKAVDQQLDVTSIQLDGGQVAHTWESLRGIYAQAANAAGALGPKGRAEAVRSVDALLLKKAAEGNGAALALMEVPNPDFDGLSLAERKEDEYARAKAEAFAQERRTIDRASSDHLRSISNEIADQQLGLSDRGPEFLVQELLAHSQQWGDKETEYRNLLGKVASAMKGRVDLRSTIDRATRGMMPNVSTSEWNKMGLALFNGAFAAQCEGEGKDPATCRAHMITMFARRGTGKELKDHLSNILLGGEGESYLPAYETAKEIFAASGSRDAAGFILSPAAADMFNYLRWSERSGTSTQKARSDYQENRERAGLRKNHALRADGRNWDNSDYEDNAKDVYDALEDEVLKTGVFGGKPGWKSTSLEVRNATKEALNTASWYLHGRSADDAEIVALAASMLEGRLILALDDDGWSVQVDRNPRVVQLPSGEQLPTRVTDKGQLQNARAYFASDDMQNFLARNGRVVRTEPNALTSAGWGDAIVVDINGVDQQVTMIPGHTFTVDNEALAEDLGQTMIGFYEIVSQTGGITQTAVGRGRTALARQTTGATTFRVPLSPAEGGSSIVQMDAGGRVFAVFNDETGYFHAQYLGEPLPTKESLARQVDVSLSTLERGAEVALFEQERQAEDDTEYLRSITEGPQFPGSLPGFGLTPGQARAATDDETRAFSTPEETSNLDQMFRGILDSFTSLRIFSPATAAEHTLDSVATEEDIITRIQETAAEEQANGGWLDNITAPASGKFVSRFTEFLVQSEGRVPYVYDDANGQRLDGRAAKGNPTIGIGLNLNSPEAKKWIEQVGLNYDRVRFGKVELTESQMNRLVALTLKDNSIWLRKKFTGVTMRNHQWMALLSLVHNARSLIGPVLTAAIRAGEWEDVALEIEFKSIANNTSGSLRKGLVRRRQREAAMFRGLFNAQPVRKPNG